ncbi:MULTISPECIES: A24 family peptidase [unclassified Variovorax]|uniref:prepilin peptidase n=1 Tax=unclassified Variovorax TaxID=663243 RepID=UPI0025773707|nr:MULTISPECIES: A24 family peptidase [unclassified Variovorax]MDM0088445.1 A24 family peptidase [Variovorax sp. J22G40]MDM0146518.1 A24 family peptidase [Variovorax sp. J2P1-31]
MFVSQGVDAALAGVLGLLIGSFLNVVIYRLPKMLERQWVSDCAGLDGSEPGAGEPFNLMVPRSRCQQCGHEIRWYENVPLLSYVLLLRGRCSSCKTPIGLRYPLVELATGLLFAWCVWRAPGQWAALAWCGFSAALLALALIDWDTTLLPDDITLPLLWAGLLASLLGLTGVALNAAVLGAAAGYLSLWSVYWLFKLATGKEGMGYGDFKLFAAFGAWFGWQALVPIVLMASVIGVIVGLALKFNNGLREGGYVPFGPFLAGAGFTAMFFGPDAILRAVGLG